MGVISFIDIDVDMDVQSLLGSTSSVLAGGISDRGK